MRPSPRPGQRLRRRPSKPAFDPSVIALLSLALGTLAAAFAGLLGFLKGFEAWQMPLVIAGSCWSSPRRPWSSPG